jgi:hypothetical protein
MSTTVDLAIHVERMLQFIKTSRQLKRQADYYRTMAGLELNAARERVKAGERGISWESWSATYVPMSWRYIDRLLELKARIRSGRPVGLWALKLHQAPEEQYPFCRSNPQPYLS